MKRSLSSTVHRGSFTRSAPVSLKVRLTSAHRDWRRGSRSFETAERYEDRSITGSSIVSDGWRENEWSEGRVFWVIWIGFIIWWDARTRMISAFNIANVCVRMMSYSSLSLRNQFNFTLSSRYVFILSLLT